jgi:hypothetical protein
MILGTFISILIDHDPSGCFFMGRSFNSEISDERILITRYQTRKENLTD